MLQCAIGGYAILKKLKIYLETTIFNFVFADDALDKKQDTIKLFDEINSGKYLPYTSDYVVQELQEAEEPKKTQMIDLIEQYKIKFLEANKDAEILADKYVAENIIPLRYRTDGLHIAIATINDLDIIVSYNLQHIVKLKTIMGTESINLREGYKRIGIYSPTEVIENE
jgi:rRNA-processing protein FCF1